MMDTIFYNGYINTLDDDDCVYEAVTVRLSWVSELISRLWMPILEQLILKKCRIFRSR